jgi:hypothetical protein
VCPVSRHSSLRRYFILVGSHRTADPESKATAKTTTKSANQANIGPGLHFCEEQPFQMYRPVPRIARPPPVHALCSALILFSTFCRWIRDRDEDGQDTGTFEANLRRRSSQKDFVSAPTTGPVPVVCAIKMR